MYFLMFGINFVSQAHHRILISSSLIEFYIYFAITSMTYRINQIPKFTVIPVQVVSMNHEVYCSEDLLILRFSSIRCYL